MNFIPMQPLQSLITGQPVDLGSKELLSWNENKTSEQKMPFASYLSQAFNGLNESLLDAAISGERAVAGQVSDLNKVALASAQAELMLKLATGIASKMTSATSTLFQMQF